MQWHCKKNVSCQLPSYFKAPGNVRHNNPADRFSPAPWRCGKFCLAGLTYSYSLLHPSIDIVHVPMRIVCRCTLSLPSHSFCASFTTHVVHHNVYYASYPEKLCVFIVEIHTSFVHHMMKQSKPAEEKWKVGAAIVNLPNTPHWKSAYIFKLLLEPAVV